MSDPLMDRIEHTFANRDRIRELEEKLTEAEAHHRLHHEQQDFLKAEFVKLEVRNAALVEALADAHLSISGEGLCEEWIVRRDALQAGITEREREILATMRARLWTNPRPTTDNRGRMGKGYMR